MKKIWFVSGFLCLGIFLGGCNKAVVENEINQAQQWQETVQKENLQTPVVAEKEPKMETDGKAKGSCNAIEKGALCLEYYGSFWTDAKMQQECERVGTFSKDLCPRNFAGGCNVGANHEADMVTWMYIQDGGAITDEALKHIKIACDSAETSQWLESR